MRAASPITKPRPGRLALRRRYFAEQWAIYLLSGIESKCAALYAGQVARLGAIAEKNGLVVKPLACYFLAVDDLVLLTWLAQAQRMLGYTRAFHPDTTLTLTVVHCAGTLDAIGIRIPLTLLVAGTHICAT